MEVTLDRLEEGTQLEQLVHAAVGQRYNIPAVGPFSRDMTAAWRLIQGLKNEALRGRLVMEYVEEKWRVYHRQKAEEQGVVATTLPLAICGLCLLVSGTVTAADWMWRAGTSVSPKAEDAAKD